MSVNRGRTVNWITSQTRTERGLQHELGGAYVTIQDWKQPRQIVAALDVRWQRECRDALRELCCERGAAQYWNRAKGAAEHSRSEHDKRVGSLQRECRYTEP